MTWDKCTNRGGPLATGRSSASRERPARRLLGGRARRSHPLGVERQKVYRLSPMNDLVQWLLEGPSWVRYRVRRDLLGQPESHPDVMESRAAMLDDPQIRGLITELADWPGPILSSHKSAGHPVHKLAFIADIGLRSDDPGIEKIVSRIVAHQAADGPFQVLMNIPAHFGGTGKDEWGWSLCDAPILVFALLKLGLSEDPRVQAPIGKLLGLVRENGWPCAVSPELGRFRGPGRKGDPCPYANLVMLKALARLPRLRDGPASRAGAEAILSLWENRRKDHPYMFFMGTDFSKMKAPLVWYDILHVAEVLTQFPRLRNDRRLKSLLAVIEKNADALGRYTAESVWTAWKEWEFGQKREPSRWLTFLCLRVLCRK